MVYFVKSNDGNIKIGYTRNLKNRLSCIKAGTPYEIEVLGAMDGGKKTEREILLRFSHLRIRGEWFRPASDLLQFIKDNTINTETLVLSSRPLPESVKRTLVKLGYNIRIARKKRSMTIANLSALAGMTPPTLIAIESGRPSVGIGNVAAALHVLNMSGDLENVAFVDVHGEKLQAARLRNIKRVRKIV